VLVICIFVCAQTHNPLHQLPGCSPQVGGNHCAWLWLIPAMLPQEKLIEIYMEVLIQIDREALGIAGDHHASAVNDEGIPLPTHYNCVLSSDGEHAFMEAQRRHANLRGLASLINPRAPLQRAARAEESGDEGSQSDSDPDLRGVLASALRRTPEVETPSSGLGIRRPSRPSALQIPSPLSADATGCATPGGSRGGRAFSSDAVTQPLLDISAAKVHMYNKGNGLSGYEPPESNLRAAQMFTFTIFYLKLCAACSLIQQLLDVSRGFMTQKALVKDLPGRFKKLKQRGHTVLPYDARLRDFLHLGKFRKDQHDLLMMFFRVFPYVQQEGLRPTIVRDGAAVAGIWPPRPEVVIERCSSAASFSLEQKQDFLYAVPGMAMDAASHNGRLTDIDMTNAGIPEGAMPLENADVRECLDLVARDDATATAKQTHRAVDRDKLCDNRQRCLFTNSREFHEAKNRGIQSEAAIKDAAEAKKTAEAKGKQDAKDAIAALKQNEIRERRQEKQRVAGEALAEKKRVAGEALAEKKRVAGEAQAEKKRVAGEAQAEKKRVAKEKKESETPAKEAMATDGAKKRRLQSVNGNTGGPPAKRNASR
jgi:hypothetical protein